MTDNESLGDLYNRIAHLESYVGAKIQHRNSDWYVVQGIHYREDDMSVWFTYRSMHKITVTFSRPIVELFDGRFKF